MKNAATSMRDRVRKRAETRRNTGGLSTLELPEGVDLYKPEKGTDEFDILPYEVSVDTHPEVKAGELWYERTYLSHRNIGPDEKTVVCPRTIGKRCPICEEHQRLKRDPNADEEVVDALRAKERELFNVVLKNGDGSVMVLDISTYLFGKMLEEEIRNGDMAVAGFADLQGGKTLKVRWAEKKMGQQKFVEASRIDFIDRDDFGEDVLEAVVDLDKALKIMSYEEIDKLFHAGEEESASDANGAEEPPAEDEPPARRGVVRRPAKPAAEDAPPDDDDLPGLEDPPRQSRKKPEPPPEDDNVCIACDGSGKTSKGKPCPICDGTGKGEPAAGEGDGLGAEEPPAEDEPPARRTAGRSVRRSEPEQEEPEKAPARRVVRR